MTRFQEESRMFEMFGLPEETIKPFAALAAPVGLNQK
jgi:hypothetical protein